MEHYMKQSYLAPLALSLLALSCSVKDSSSPEQSGLTQTQYDQTVADLPPVPVSITTIDPILNGDTIKVALGTSEVGLSLAKTSDNQTVLTMNGADGVVTYFQKESETVALKRTEDLGTFLQGVWVAIAQVKGGVYFKLVVDPQNRLTLVIENTDSGVQVDIQVQGTPNQEELDKAEKIFLAWQAGDTLSSSSAELPASSSSVELLASSSSSAWELPVSSSFITEWPLSSSVWIIDPPISSSTLVEYPPSSSAPLLPSSSSVALPSSSSGEFCLFDEYQGYFIEMLSADGFSKTSCYAGFMNIQKNDGVHYYSISISPYYSALTKYSVTTTSGEINQYASTTTVRRTNADGQQLDFGACTRTIQVDGGTLWQYTETDQTFLSCMNGI